MQVALQSLVILFLATYQRKSISKKKEKEVVSISNRNPQTLEKRNSFHHQPSPPPPPPPTLITRTSCSLYAVHVDCSHHRVNIDQVNRREEEE
jgi:hypothetical protein